jgi:hypothetical protein
MEVDFKTMKQSGVRHWLGAFLVQLSNSFFYVSILNTGLLALTFWSTSGVSLAKTYAPWLTLWYFLAIVIGVFSLIMFLDYKFMYPSRQAFINEQACKHSNPAMDELLAIRKENADIKAKLEELLKERVNK